MIPKQYTPLVLAFFMAFVMSGIMSFVITVFNVGLITGVLVTWVRSWAFAFTVALPTVVTISPLVKKLALCFIKDD